MKKYEFHSASNVFRLLDKDERKGMRESIQSHGQQVSVKLLDGKILDGRNRYLCCQELDIDPWVETLARGDLDGMSPMDYVRVMNDHRRHDDFNQRAIASAKMKQEYEREAVERSHKNLKKGREDPDPANLPTREIGESRDRAAEAMGVSPRTVTSAEKVIENAPASVVKAVEHGDVAVSDAAAISDQPKDVQAAALKAVQSGEARTLKAAVKEIEQTYKPEPSKPAPKDSEGNEIPRKLQPAFERAKEFEEQARKLEAIAQWAEQITQDDAGVFLHLQTFVADLHNAKRALRFSKPYAVCPYCHGKKCEACREKGFVSKGVFKAAPKEK